jgi:hypothetical protein
MALEKAGFIPIPRGTQPGSPGIVSVIDEQRLETLGTVETEPEAHTICWNPDTHTLYAFLPASGGAAVFAEQ